MPNALQSCMKAKIINNALKEIYKEAVIIKAKELGNLVNIRNQRAGQL